MRGPIDYIIVGFEGNRFNGSILKALSHAIDAGTIGLVALSVVSKDARGRVSLLDASEFGDTSFARLAADNRGAGTVTQADIEEVAELVNNNCTAGLLVIEQLWAKPLKQAVLDAHGVLLAEGRIHPDAQQELEAN